MIRMAAGAMKKAFITLSIFLSGSVVSNAIETLHYEPVVVTLQGTLSLQDFAGPPNYEDIKKGDRLEQSWILTLKSPVRVEASAGDDLYYTQENIREIQLVCAKECGKKFSLSSGRKATLIGTLFSAHTGHHYKSVLMNVKRRK